MKTVAKVQTNRLKNVHNVTFINFFLFYKGDSGGPLMKLVNRNQQIFWVLYGIVSYGAYPCGQANIPGVYTKVDQFIDWIQSKLRL